MDTIWVVYVFDREVEDFTVRHIRTNKEDAQRLFEEMQADSDVKLVGAVVDRSHDALVRSLIMERLSDLLSPRTEDAIRAEMFMLELAEKEETGV
jgi:uncharacterized protein (UPF0276 family)